MKKRADKLEPLPTLTKPEASYEKLMLEMMSKLVGETRENNLLIRENYGKDSKMHRATESNFRDRTNIIGRKESAEPREGNLSPKNDERSFIIEEVEESQSGHNLKPKGLKSSPSSARLEIDTQDKQSKLQKLLSGIERRLQAGEEINRKLLERIEQLHNEKTMNYASQRTITEDKKQEMSLIEKALADKIKTTSNFNNPANSTQKKSYVILSQILPYSDRREMKVKFKISDIVSKQQSSKIDMKIQTAQWLGMVYRATASICWNMLLNNYLNFQEVKILFTENIVFNFIEFMNELSRMGKDSMREKLTELINQKSVDILDFLCRQYPQTKIEAPNITLRSLLPQIDNQGRIKYDLVSKSAISFTYKEDGDYTAQIMMMINYMIDKTNEDSYDFHNFMKDTFEEIYIPLHKRRKFGQNGTINSQKELMHEDIAYKEKVKLYTKYLIGRKISKNTSKYNEQQIQDGIFFVKSSGVLRIITKWVEDLMEYFLKPEQKIKNSYSETKDHSGKLIYISALLKNGLHKQILKDRVYLTEKIKEIKKECYKMELLLTGEYFTSDSTQVHLSQEQISVGMYCSNLKSAISSYICSQLNELIHYLLKIPREVNEDDLGSDLQDFKSQARKDLDSLNLVTFKLFDLLRCKIHSNQEQIIWIVQYLLDQNKTNKDKFNIVRIKDRLNQGTRDIMINAQINKGLVCEIQLSVTSNTDKKQELLDQYNHFLYELKRSMLGPITENVSIWSTLEQRYSYFEQLIKQKNKQKPKGQKLKHHCGNDSFVIFKRPIICQCCNNFYAIPKTCLLSVMCEQCNTSFCGQCYYQNYLSSEQRKLYIFDKYKLLKNDVLGRLKEYTDFTKPLPATGFFIKKRFLKKELSFYMAIEKNKNEKIKDAPSIELIIIQTIIRNDKILNRQVNRKEIQAKLEKGQFYVKNYEKTELNSFIIFYFQKKQNKKLMTLKELQTELQKPDNRRTKILSLVREPSYISDLHLLKKDTEKVRQMNNLLKVINEDKITVFMFNNLFILAQACVKGSVLRAEITKKVNTSALKSFAYKESDIVSMQHKNMTTELEDISFKMKLFLYESFCHNIKKLFLANGNITSIKCFSKFKFLEFVVISDNKLTSLEGIEDLDQLVSFRFDGNEVESLEPFTSLVVMKYISGNKNKINSLKGVQNLNDLKNLSLYENNISSIEQLANKTTLEELYLRENPITDLSLVSGLTGLAKLFIGKTNITDIPDLSGLVKLRSLSLEFLKLTSIPNLFSSLKLHQLWLSNNCIRTIQNLDSQTDLTYLNLSNNEIEKIDNLKTLDRLESLRLDSNQIKTVENVKDLDALKYINLKSNPIEDIEELTRFQITFEYEFSPDCLSEKAKKQLVELQTNRDNVSSGED